MTIVSEPASFLQIKRSNPRVVRGSVSSSAVKSRVYVAMLAFACVYAAIAGRLVLLAQMEEAPSRAWISAQDSVSASRPDLIDRNGEILATDIKTASLYAEPRRILDVDEAVEGLIRVLPELDEGLVRRRLESGAGFDLQIDDAGGRRFVDMAAAHPETPDADRGQIRQDLRLPVDVGQFLEDHLRRREAGRCGGHGDRRFKPRSVGLRVQDRFDDAVIRKPEIAGPTRRLRQFARSVERGLRFEDGDGDGERLQRRLERGDSRRGRRHRCPPGLAHMRRLTSSRRSWR